MDLLLTICERFSEYLLGSCFANDVNDNKKTDYPHVNMDSRFEN